MAPDRTPAPGTPRALTALPAEERQRRGDLVQRAWPILLILLVAWLPMVMREWPLSLPILCVGIGYGWTRLGRPFDPGFATATIAVGGTLGISAALVSAANALAPHATFMSIAPGSRGSDGSPMTAWKPICFSLQRGPQRKVGWPARLRLIVGSTDLSSMFQSSSTDPNYLQCSVFS